MPCALALRSALGQGSLGTTCGDRFLSGRHLFINDLRYRPLAQMTSSDQPARLSKFELQSGSGLLRVNAPEQHSMPYIKGFLANVRSLRQAAGDVRRLIVDADVDMFAVTETHLRDDPIRSLLPSGYRVISRYDRTTKGGGVAVGCRNHLLASPLDLSKYTTPMEAEMAGFELDGVDYIACYTSNSTTARVLIERCTKYMSDFPLHRVIFLGDFNVHHCEWLKSVSPTDHAGSAALAMCDTFDLTQLVHFPTRGGNKLDLILSPFSGTSTPRAHAGSSDHLSVVFKICVPKPLVDATEDTLVRDWQHAPWHHIKGAIRRYPKDWDPTSFESSSLAQANLSEWIEEIIDRYVPFARHITCTKAPWWNFHCEKAYRLKQKKSSLRGLILLLTLRLLTGIAVFKRKLSRPTTSSSELDCSRWEPPTAPFGTL